MRLGPRQLGLRLGRVPQHFTAAATPGQQALQAAQAAGFPFQGFADALDLGGRLDRGHDAKVGPFVGSRHTNLLYPERA